MTSSEYLGNDSLGIAICKSALSALVYLGGPLEELGSVLGWSSVGNMSKHMDTLRKPELSSEWQVPCSIGFPH